MKHSLPLLLVVYLILQHCCIVPGCFQCVQHLLLLQAPDSPTMAIYTPQQLLLPTLLPLRLLQRLLQHKRASWLEAAAAGIWYAPLLGTSGRL
jgi:hypothetical protein